MKPVPQRNLLQRLTWFVVLWAASVLALAGVAAALRAIMFSAGMRT